MMGNWANQPVWFRTLAYLTGAFAALMSFAPPLVYAGMAPLIKSNMLAEVILERGVPIIGAYLVILSLALKSDPSRRQAVAVALLTATLPISWLLMVHGLR